MEALKYGETFLDQWLVGEENYKRLAVIGVLQRSRIFFYLFISSNIVGRGDSGNILLPGVTTLSSFPVLEQTNIILVTLLSFERDLMKNTILSPLSY